MAQPAQALLEAAQRRGLGTVVLTNGPPVAGDVEHHVDRWMQSDTHDSTAVAATAAKLGEAVVAVVSPVAESVAVAASAARLLGRPGPGLDSPSRARDNLLPAAAVGELVPIRDRRVSFRDAPLEICQARPRRPTSQTLTLRRPRGAPAPRAHVEKQAGSLGCRAEGFIEAWQCRIFAWTEFSSLATASGQEMVSTVRLSPPSAEAEEAVLSALTSQGYHFGPFHAEISAEPQGTHRLRWWPASGEGLAGRCVEAVSGFDPADYFLSRLLGEVPAERRRSANAAVQLQLTSTTTHRPPSRARVRATGDVPGFVAAQVSANSEGALRRRVITLGNSPDQAQRRARAAMAFLRAEATPVSRDPVPRSTA